MKQSVFFFTSVVLLILLLLLGFRYYYLDKQLSSIETIAAQANQQFFTIKKDNETKTQQAQQAQLIVSKKNKEIQALLDTIRGLKKVTARVEYRTVTTIKRDTLRYSDTVKIIQHNDYDYLQLPYSASKQTKWYGYNITLAQSGLTLDSLYFISEVNLTLSDKDLGFWRNITSPTQRIVTLETKNPYTTVTGMKNLIIKDRPKHFGIGVSVGYGATNTGFSPYIGLGLNYQIISF